MSQVQKYLEKHMKEKIKGKGKYAYVLIESFDDEAENEVIVNRKKKLNPGDSFKIQDITYEVEYTEWYGSEKTGKALVRMVRYKIPDTATQFVHKCPVRKKQAKSMTDEDVLKFEKELGKRKANKKMAYMKEGRVKMQSYNKLEIECPLCKCVFYKNYNLIPQSVTINRGMKKKRLKK